MELRLQALLAALLLALSVQLAQFGQAAALQVAGARSELYLNEYFIQQF